MSPRPRLVGGVLTLCLLSGCVSGRYRRFSVNEPKAETSLQPLLERSAGLQECLDALGAPNFVWPTDVGTAMAYAHTFEKGWRLRVSAPVKRVSGSVTYNSSLEKGQAVVLFFDDDWNLRFLRRGKLVDILQQHPRRIPPVAPRT